MRQKELKCYSPKHHEKNQTNYQVPEPTVAFVLEWPKCKTAQSRLAAAQTLPLAAASEAILMATSACASVYPMV